MSEDTQNPAPTPTPAPAPADTPSPTPAPAPAVTIPEGFPEYALTDGQPNLEVIAKDLGRVADLEARTTAPETYTFALPKDAEWQSGQAPTVNFDDPAFAELGEGLRAAGAPQGVADHVVTAFAKYVDRVTHEASAATAQAVEGLAPEGAENKLEAGLARMKRLEERLIALDGEGGKAIAHSINDPALVPFIERALDALAGPDVAGSKTNEEVALTGEQRAQDFYKRARKTQKRSN